MTKKQKAERVIQWLTEDHLFLHGGYPYDCVEHAGKLFVAELSGEDRNGTAIKVYDLAELPKWYDRAADWLWREGEDLPPWPEWQTGCFDEWSPAFNETAPEQKELT